MFHHKILSGYVRHVCMRKHSHSSTGCYIALITSTLLHAHMRCITVFASILINIWSHGVLFRRGSNTEMMMPSWNAISTVIANARTLCNDVEPLSGFLSWMLQNCRCWFRRCSQRWKVLMTTASYPSLHICWTYAMKGRRWSWSLIK